MCTVSSSVKARVGGREGVCLGLPYGNFPQLPGCHARSDVLHACVMVDGQHDGQGHVWKGHRAGGLGALHVSDRHDPNYLKPGVANAGRHGNGAYGNGAI